MTGGGGVMTTSDSKRHLQRSPDLLAGFEGMGRAKEKEGSGKKTKRRVKGREGREKENGRKKRKIKKRRKSRGRGRERRYPTFWYKMTPKSASDMCYALLLFTLLMNERVNHSQS